MFWCWHNLLYNSTFMILDAALLRASTGFFLCFLFLIFGILLLGVTHFIQRLRARNRLAL